MNTDVSIDKSRFAVQAVTFDSLLVNRWRIDGQAEKERSLMIKVQRSVCDWALAGENTH